MPYHQIYQKKGKKKFFKKKFKFSVEGFSSMIKISPIFTNEKDNRNKLITPLIKFSPFIETPQRSNLRKSFQKIFSNNPILGRSIFNDCDTSDNFFNEKENKNKDNKKPNKKITIVSSLFVKPDDNNKNKYFIDNNSTEKNHYFNNENKRDILLNETNYKCSCSKTGCNKNYCQCFSSGRYCSDCNCKNCRNKDLNNSNFDKSIYFKENTKKKIQREIKKKIINECTCSRSNCNKKYCECFRKGLKCTSKCRCVNCHNCENKIDDLCENRCIVFSIINNKFINYKESNVSFFTPRNEQRIFIGNKRKKDCEKTNFTSSKKEKFIDLSSRKKGKNKLKKFRLK